MPELEAGTYTAVFPFTAAQLMSIAGGAVSLASIVPDTPGTCELLCRSVRVREIEVWAPAFVASQLQTGPAYSNLTVPGNVSVQWIGEYGATTEHSDYTASTAVLAHVKSRPPARSSAAFWQADATQTEPVCVLELSPGAVVDFSLELFLYDQAAVPNPGVETFANENYDVGTACGNLLWPVFSSGAGLTLRPFRLTPSQ